MFPSQCGGRGSKVLAVLPESNSKVHLLCFQHGQKQKLVIPDDIFCCLFYVLRRLNLLKHVHQLPAVYLWSVEERLVLPWLLGWVFAEVFLVCSLRLIGLDMCGSVRPGWTGFTSVFAFALPAAWHLQQLRIICTVSPGRHTSDHPHIENESYRPAFTWPVLPTLAIISFFFAQGWTPRQLCLVDVSRGSSCEGEFSLKILTLGRLRGSVFCSHAL